MRRARAKTVRRAPVVAAVVDTAATVVDDAITATRPCWSVLRNAVLEGAGAERFPRLISKLGCRFLPVSIGAGTKVCWTKEYCPPTRRGADVDSVLVPG